MERINKKNSTEIFHGPHLFFPSSLASGQAERSLHDG